jgi:hypothetical protein
MEYRRGRMTQAGIVVLTIPSPANLHPFAVRNEGGPNINPNTNININPNTKIQVVYTEELTHL